MLVQRELKKNCTYKIHPSTIKMLDEISATTKISRSEIIAQLIESYYTTNNLILKKGGQ